jgi:hypothetical protein
MKNFAEGKSVIDVTLFPLSFALLRRIKLKELLVT